jgi:hypothetical protein
MTPFEQHMIEQLSVIQRQLDALLVPVFRQQGKQMAAQTPEEIRAENKAILARGKLRRAGK